MKEKLVILTPADRPDLLEMWEKAAEDVLGDAHPGRKAEWALARVALQLALENFNFHLTPSKRIIGHQLIKDFPEVRFSLSHTKGFGGAWVHEGSGAIGLDIEKADRPLNEEIAERLKHPDDVQLPLMQLWTIKEAAYKCLPPEIQSKIWLHKIAVKEKAFIAEGVQGPWAIREERGLLISQALLRIS